MPCLRHRSAHFAPASCSVKIPMICSSLYLVLFIVRPFVGPDSNSNWRKNPVAGQPVQTVFKVALDAMQDSAIKPSLNYVFGSYCLSGDGKVSRKEKSLLKVLA